MNTEIRTRLFDLYQDAASFMMEKSDAPTELDIINKAADILCSYDECEFADCTELQHLLFRCVMYVNKDFEEGKEPTLCEYIGMAYDLIEELSGTLGQFFE